MNEEVPFNPPGMADYIREGARKNSALLAKLQRQSKSANSEPAKPSSLERVVSWRSYTGTSILKHATIECVPAWPSLCGLIPDKTWKEPSADAEECHRCLSKLKPANDQAQRLAENNPKV